MPVYATLDDMIARFRREPLEQLADDAGAGVELASRVGQALRTADGLINGYVAAAYQLPIAPVPDVLVDIACDIARYEMDRSSPIEVVVERYKASLARLRDIQAGKLKLDAGAPEQRARDGVVLVEGGAPLFTRDSMRGF